MAQARRAWNIEAPEPRVHHVIHIVVSTRPISYHLIAIYSQIASPRAPPLPFLSRVERTCSSSSNWYASHFYDGSVYPVTERCRSVSLDTMRKLCAPQVGPHFPKWAARRMGRLTFDRHSWGPLARRRSWQR